MTMFHRTSFSALNSIAANALLSAHTCDPSVFQKLPPTVSAHLSP